MKLLNMTAFELLCDVNTDVAIKTKPGEVRFCVAEACIGPEQERRRLNRNCPLGWRAESSKQRFSTEKMKSML